MFLNNPQNQPPPQYEEEMDEGESQPQQQQYPPQFSPFYNQQQMVLPSDVIKYRLESEDILETLEHDLKGEVFVNRKWQPAYGRWINDEGLSTIKSIAARYCNRGCFLGNLSLEQINYKCKAIKIELAKLLFKKYKQYEVDKAKRSLLIRKIVDTIHLALSRTEQGMESAQLSSSTQRSEVIHEEKNSNSGNTPNLLRFFRLKPK